MKVLVIQQRYGIGDMVIFTPYFHAISKKCKSPITILAKKSSKAEELFLQDKNIKEVADALTDILYVTYGAGHAFGINLDKCFEEVQNSNMSKLGEDGKPIYNEFGKVMKGPKYFKPNLEKLINER